MNAICLNKSNETNNMCPVPFTVYVAGVKNEMRACALVYAHSIHGLAHNLF